MSSCNCKSTENTSNEQIIKKSGIHPVHSFLIYTAKSIGFLISLILLPIINFMLIKLMFQAIVLNKNIDLKKTLEYYFKKKKEEEDFEDDEDDLTDEYKMLNVEEIKTIN